MSKLILTDKQVINVLSNVLVPEAAEDSYFPASTEFITREKMRRPLCSSRSLESVSSHTDRDTKSSRRQILDTSHPLLHTHIQPLQQDSYYCGIWNRKCNIIFAEQGC